MLIFLAIIFIILTIFYLPFIKTSGYKPISRIIFIPLQHEFNDSLFLVIKNLLGNFVSSSQTAIHLSSVISLSLLSLVVLYLTSRRFSVGICIVTMIAFLLFSPIAYPWYIIFLTCLIFWYAHIRKNFVVIFFLIYMQALISFTYISEIYSLNYGSLVFLMRVIAVLEVVSLAVIYFVMRRTHVKT